MELKNAKYQFGVENTESKIPNLRYIGLFSQKIILQNRRIVKCTFYIQLKLSLSRSMLIFYTPWKHQKTTFLMFQGAQKGVLTCNGLKNNNIGESGTI